MTYRFIIQNHTKYIERYLRDCPDCKLIILDPITGYMGDAKSKFTGGGREVLLEVVSLAERTNVTVVGLSHMNKKIDLGMKYRSIGSIAFNAVPRSVWGIYVKNDDDHDSDTENLPTRRIFFPIKDNLCIEPTALEFCIIEGRVVLGICYQIRN